MIVTQRLSDGTLIFLPLCPSTNARMRPVRMGSRCRDILTAEARDYIQSVGFALRLWARAQKFRPLDNYFRLDLWFILPRINCDAHNYGKVLFDALGAGGIVANDKYVLPRVMGVWHDPKAEVIVKIPAARRV
ncbi:MAG: RusA family crossover junction endodeoxyribonuclease [Elusimicrobiota bacterium]